MDRITGFGPVDGGSIPSGPVGNGGKVLLFGLRTCLI